MTFHIVHSVKGGCGKTTTAMTLAAELGQKDETTVVSTAETGETTEDTLGTDRRDMRATTAKPPSQSETGGTESAKEDDGGDTSAPEKGNPGSVATEAQKHEFCKSKVILLDLDLKGTAMEAIVFPPVNKDNGGIHVEPGKETDITLKLKNTNVNGKVDLLRGNGYITDYFTDNADFKSIITQIDSTHCRFDVALGNPSQIAKRKFYTVNNSVDVSIFTYRFRNLIYLFQKESYDHVVIDMPPGADEYTEAIYKCLLPANRENASQWDTRLYYVASPDTAHLSAAGEFLNTMLFKQQLSMERSRPSKIVVVLNDNHGRIASYYKTGNNKLLTNAKDYIAACNTSLDFQQKALSINKLIIDGIIKESANIASSNHYDDKLFFAYSPHNEQFSEQSTLFTSSNENNLHLEALVYVKETDMGALVKRSQPLFSVNEKDYLLKSLPIEPKAEVEKS